MLILLVFCLPKLPLNPSLLNPLLNASFLLLPVPSYSLPKLQTEIAVSTTDAEYIVMSQAAHDSIPMRDLLHDFSSTTICWWHHHSLYHFWRQQRLCRLADPLKLIPKTNHIGLKYHHFLPMSPVVPSKFNGLTPSTSWLMENPLTLTLHIQYTSVHILAPVQNNPAEKQ